MTRDAIAHLQRAPMTCLLAGNHGRDHLHRGRVHRLVSGDAHQQREQLAPTSAVATAVCCTG